jgi:hypothetical protein
VDPADEGRHPSGDEPYWGESYYLDFVSSSGQWAGYTRIGYYPNLGACWWTTAVVGEGCPLYSSNDHGLALESGTVTGAAGTVGTASFPDGRSVLYDAVEPLQTMTVRGRAPARALDDPADAYAASPGAPTDLEFDLTWTTDGSPYHYDVTTRYEIPCTVSGEVVVGDERITVDGHGQRDHSWGVRDWWAFGWCWAAVRLDDGTRVHWADIRMPGTRVGLGYLQKSGEVRPLSSLDVEEELGGQGLPRSAAARVAPGDLRLEIEPRWFGPALFEADDGRLSRFPRAAARFHTDDGRSGIGWIEWNQPQDGVGTG